MEVYLPVYAHVQLKQKCQKGLQGLNSFPVWDILGGESWGLKEWEPGG